MILVSLAMLFAAALVVALAFRVGRGPGGEATAEDDASTAGGVVCYGQVDLRHGVTSLVPLQGGRVAAVLVEENRHVAAGTVLLRLDDRLARSRVAEAESALGAAEAQLAAARRLPAQQRQRLALQQAAVDAMQARLEAARKTLARQRRHQQMNLVDAREVEIGGDQLKEIESLARAEEHRLTELKGYDPQPDVRRVEQEVSAWQARLDQARLALQECAVTAPAAGTVLRLLVGPGDVVGAAGQPAVLFAADGPAIVRAEVEQEFAGQLQVGQPAVVVDDNAQTATPQSWKGTVEQVASWYGRRRAVLPDPLALSDVLTVECVIRLDPGTAPFRIAQRVRVFIGPAAVALTETPPQP
ncbi:MAG: HlyD family efflux transporter periplasmic adaptor subunit [Gemmataceae bacterium]